MPYSRLNELPEAVRKLPEHAQHIFRGAFNAAFKDHGEERAFAIAWSAVKKKYRKNGDQWVAMEQGAMAAEGQDFTQDEAVLDAAITPSRTPSERTAPEGGEIRDESVLDEPVLQDQPYGKAKSRHVCANDSMHRPAASEGGDDKLAIGDDKGTEYIGSGYFMKQADGSLQLRPILGQKNEAGSDLNPAETLKQLDEAWQELGTLDLQSIEKAQIFAQLRGFYHSMNELPPDARKSSTEKGRIDPNPEPPVEIIMAEPEWVQAGGDPPGGAVDLVQSQPVLLQTERYDKDSGILHVRGTATTANVINTKREVYPLEVWQDNVPRLKRLLEQGKLLGECDHPRDGRPSLDRTCVKFTDLWLEGNDVKFKAQIIPTEPHGKNLIKLIQAGVPVDISSRGRGDKKRLTWNDVPDVEVVQRGFRCNAFDAVVAGASPNSRVESWEIAQSQAADLTEGDMELLEGIAQQLKDLAARQETMGAELTAMKGGNETTQTAEQDEVRKAEAERETKRVAKLEGLLIRERIESLVQEQSETLPNQWLNMYRKLLTNSGGSTLDTLEGYAATALQIVQDTYAAAPKYPGRGHVIVKGKGEKGPRTPRELIESLIEDLPDDVPAGMTGMRQSEDEEAGVPDHIRSPRRQCRRILTNIATHRSGSWDGPTAIRGLLMMEQGYGAEEVTNFLDQACTDGTTAVGAGGAPQSNIFIFPLIRRVFPQLIATELASVQPMDRPDGKIFFLDAYRISTGVNSLDEAGATISNRMRMDRSDSFNSSYADDPGECNVSTLLQLRLSSVSVTAQTKKLHAIWSIEELQDLRAYHGLDVASELVSALSREIALEWNQIVLQEMLTGQTGGNSNFGTTAPAGYTQKEWDEYLPRYLDKASNDIFKKRYGDMTHVIAGPDAWLKLAAAFRVGTKPAGSNPEMFAGLTLTPFMSGSMVNLKTYKCSFWSSINTTKILVLRRGSDWSDTPYVWAPYIDYISPTLTLPDVFTQKQGIMSRAAHKVVISDALATVTIQQGVAGTAL